jgi:hypothetical protein
LLGAFSWFVGSESGSARDDEAEKPSEKKGTSAAWMFLNRTSLHPIYTSRLIRAYLGASNWYRHGKEGAGVTDVVSGDDISQERYWINPEERFFKRGAPLHLVNSTLNETLSGRSQVEQRDRHGLGLAVGPAGLSAGVRHHAVYVQPSNKDDDKSTRVEVFPQAPDEFRVFDYSFLSAEKPKLIARFAGEQLSLGDWTGVSGAAAATGMGYRTSLGLSLLLGFFNVRLGYWWDSGAPLRSEPAKLTRKIGQWINTHLPVQTYLLDEMLGRFHGPARRRWYLSDGGNFENLGGYELIRRRLPLIVIIDAGADPDYGFEDTANLVRKARLDFNAEIKFLDGAEIAADLKGRGLEGLRKFYGTLDELRRGPWVDEPLPGEQKSSRVSFDSSDSLRYSLKYVALARIHYLDNGDDEKDDSDLIIIKPTLIGDEPADILQYHNRRPSFPHESTAEQFFDEAQWESYRRLGQHIGESIFFEKGGFLAPRGQKTPPAPH